MHIEMHLTEKEIEAQYLNLLRQSIDTFPSGDITPFERPDFILTTADTKIGIEVTKIYKSSDSLGNQFQAQEDEQRLLRAECKKVYDSMNLPGIEVHILFNSFTHFNKKNRRGFAKKICLLVASYLPLANNVAQIDNDYKDPNIFPFEIYSISIYRFDFSESVWGESGTGLVQEEFIAELQDVINKKNLLINGYDRSCKYHWLLVIIEGLNESSFFDPSDDTLNHIYKTSFNKVFLYNGFGAKGHELNIEITVEPCRE